MLSDGKWYGIGSLPIGEIIDICGLATTMVCVVTTGVVARELGTDEKLVVGKELANVEPLVVEQVTELMVVIVLEVPSSPAWILNITTTKNSTYNLCAKHSTMQQK